MASGTKGDMFDSLHLSSSFPLKNKNSGPVCAKSSEWRCGWLCVDGDEIRTPPPPLGTRTPPAGRRAKRATCDWCWAPTQRAFTDTTEEQDMLFCPSWIGGLRGSTLEIQLIDLLIDSSQPFQTFFCPKHPPLWGTVKWAQVPLQTRPIGQMPLKFKFVQSWNTARRLQNAQHSWDSEWRGVKTVDLVDTYFTSSTCPFLHLPVCVFPSCLVSTSVLFPPRVFLCCPARVPRAPSGFIGLFRLVLFFSYFLDCPSLFLSVFVVCLWFFFFFLGLQLTFIIEAAFCSFIHLSWCLAFGLAQKVYFYFLFLVYFKVNTIDVLQFTRCSKMFFFFLLDMLLHPSILPGLPL